ncbi:hypothetical protein HYH02_000164 [Chlamydomonas schloesseri]|uniref:Uncharacterized protein n=1 Tax=Chlamydomonas schloesseri TaxID=2026947 RepID=A0A835WNU6_9CHLO|nr:hypothetical protein HYH02_000164 [Chlamydomonas schloesseri]|eukprot:KAG2450060.1 hypothetical protein HYH02_000164 [Chlamydomonas schloesseri]
MAAPAAAAAASHSAVATAPTAGRKQAVLPADDDVAAHSSVAAISVAPASWYLTTCRRRHVHRPALGQE